MPWTSSFLLLPHERMRWSHSILSQTDFDFVHEVLLVFHNALVYNDDQSVIAEEARTLLEIFTRQANSFLPRQVRLHRRNIRSVSIPRQCLWVRVRVRVRFWTLGSVPGSVLNLGFGSLGSVPGSVLNLGFGSEPWVRLNLGFGSGFGSEPCVRFRVRFWTLSSVPGSVSELGFGSEVSRELGNKTDSQSPKETSLVTYKCNLGSK